MTTGDLPWESPVAGTGTEHLPGALDGLRTTVGWTADTGPADPMGRRASTDPGRSSG